jgi:hypothetical protein
LLHQTPSWHNASQAALVLSVQWTSSVYSREQNNTLLKLVALGMLDGIACPGKKHFT